MGRLATVVLIATLAACLSACRREGCLGGDDGECRPPTACGALSYQCGALSGTLSVSRLGADPPRAFGPKAMATTGDFLLENDLVRVVVDAPDHPQHLAPSGGQILDLSPVGVVRTPTTGDQINGISHAAGLLPRDAVRYERWEIDQHSGDSPSDRYVAVVFRGHLDGDPRVTVVTRYELRPCEPGIRVRSDLFNGAPDPNTLFLTDGFFWGDQGLLPFVPGPGLGFQAPELELLHVDRAWRSGALLAARAQAAPETSYAVVSCDRPAVAGFSTTTLSAAGVPLRPTLAGDGISYERFILAAPGPGLAPAVAEALRVRTMVRGEPWPVTVTGRVVANGVPFESRSGRAASLLFYEPAFGADPDDPTRRTPWSEAVPDAEGRFSVTLPPNRSYRVQPHAFGRPAAAPTTFVVGEGSSDPKVTTDVGDITVNPPARLIATVLPVTEASELVVIPVSSPGAANPPSFYGQWPGCNPMLGPPHGGSPACNRALTTDGRFDLLLPPGPYYVYATRGPFSTLARTEINLGAGQQTQIELRVDPLPDVLPTGVLSGDFHVHGAGSYDSSIPDQDRVVSFLAADVDVVVATDHDVVTSYAATLTALSATTKIVVIPGVEQTPNIIWFAVPGEDFPKTLGHFNFWPLVPDRGQPRNGAPWDELREPGQMMDDMEALFAAAGDPEGGVRQLNHPFSGEKLGRDQGFLRAIGYDPRTPVTAGASFAADTLLHQPGGRRRNLDWDTQEIMTGASRAEWLRYRALWFSLLSQGILRAGVANSDTHSLALERVGYPRNLIFGGHDRGRLAEPAGLAKFDADVRAGHVVGTNGPVLEATLVDRDGAVRTPGLDGEVVLGADAELTVTVKSAPWIPVEEIRLFVNGRQVQTIDVSGTLVRADHFARVAATHRTTIRLAPFLSSLSGDAWLVVEAGMRQVTPLDVDDDGLPDLPDADLPRRPADPSDRRFDLEAVAPGVWPTAFTNPFLIDMDGGGWRAPGL